MTKFVYRDLLRVAVFLIIGCIFSCKSGPFNVFKPGSLHEIYERKLVTSGLDQTAMGKAWIELADQSLIKAVAIQIPYREKGYFTAEKVQAAAFRFNMERGQKLQIKLLRKPLAGFTIYADVWEQEEGGELRALISPDSTVSVFQSAIKSAASESSFRVELPDSSLGYLPKNRVLSTSKPLLQHKIDPKQQELYDRPDSSAAVKINLKAGQTVQVLGNFGNYQFVSDSNKETGWILK